MRGLHRLPAEQSMQRALAWLAPGPMPAFRGASASRTGSSGAPDTPLQLPQSYKFCEVAPLVPFQGPAVVDYLAGKGTQPNHSAFG